jgi:hypothetical protein
MNPPSIRQRGNSAIINALRGANGMNAKRSLLADKESASRMKNNAHEATGITSARNVTLVSDGCHALSCRRIR